MLSVLEQCDQELQKKIREQTILVLRLVYECHYSTKHLFQCYLFINNLLFQSLINALILTFFMDLAMMWENKYDLNLLRTTIREAKGYNPKEK